MNAVAGQAFDVQSVRLAMREAEAKTIEAHMFRRRETFPMRFPKSASACASALED